MSPTKIGNVLSWASDIEPGTIDQAQKAASLPFIAGHVALMPDAHIGFGSTVGSVIATRGAIIPSAIGVDIGCGMAAVPLNVTADRLPDDLGAVHTAITGAVPAGVGQGHGDGRTHDLIRKAATGAVGALLEDRRVDLTGEQANRAAVQMGSLGSGNHFVELCIDETDGVWVMLHSGSRGIGNILARDHIEAAKGLMARYFIDLPDPDLAYFVEGTPEFDRYISAMLWAQDYARVNRDTMLRAVLSVVLPHVGYGPEDVGRFMGAAINCHHNYCERENHGGNNLWVTRKGAVRAREGDFGIIPGSMGTRSYIVEGKGNPSSFNSCSHGAGRRMSRGQARRELDVDTLRTQMAGKAWNDGDAEKLIDEDPRSYKDIDQVMADQDDLVTVLHTLTQILNYKGL